jgi:hypothetical protein
MSIDHFGPFGTIGNDVGQCAIELLGELSKPAPSLVGLDDKLLVWGAEDRFTFTNLGELEFGSRFIDPEPGIDGGKIGDLHRALHRFHTALPLSEAERYWLFDPLHKDQEGQPDIGEPETLIGTTAEVVSGGLRQVIEGREVLRRMAAWRRETDEFTGQGTLNEAREALGEIALMLVMEANWPREHEDLRAKLLKQ